MLKGSVFMKVVNGIGEIYYDYDWKKKEKIKLKDFELEVIFNGWEDDEINEVQKETYLFVTKKS